MFDLGPHAGFIIAAYGVAFVALGALTVATFADDREQRRMLAELERKGIRRRSAASPATPKVTSKAAKPTTKPRSSAAPAKRKPASPRARKTRS